MNGLEATSISIPETDSCSDRLSALSRVVEIIQRRHRSARQERDADRLLATSIVERNKQCSQQHTYSMHSY